MERLPQPQQSPSASQDSDGKSTLTEMEGTEMSLREHLLAASAVGNHEQYGPDLTATSHGHLDPAIIPTNISSPRGLVTVPIEGHILPPNTHQRGRRELSGSKRAAQNRAAQRAFRQRKEGYIKKLEDQVRSFNALQDTYKHVQAENYDLREYALTLQNRLADSGIDIPGPPPSLDLQNPPPPFKLLDDLTELRQHLEGATDSAGEGDGEGAPTAPMASADVSQLQQAAVEAGQYVAQELESGDHGDIGSNAADRDANTTEQRLADAIR